MLIPPKVLHRYWHLEPAIVIHVGAHEAEELEDYLALGWGRRETVWIEALPSKTQVVMELIRGIENQRVINAVAWDVTGEVVHFNETNNGQSSSALRLGLHADTYPHIRVTEVTERRTTRLDEVVNFKALAPVGLVNLDVQGAELRVLKGLGDGIDAVEAIYSEVNITELYVGCSLLPEMDAWLTSKGFHLVDWEILPEGWGDALWLRSDRLPSHSAWIRRRRRSRDAVGRLLSKARSLSAHVVAGVSARIIARQ